MRRTVPVAFLFAISVFVSAEAPLGGRRGPAVTSIQREAPPSVRAAAEAPVVAIATEAVATAALAPSRALVIGNTRTLDRAVHVRNTVTERSASMQWRGTVRVPGAQRSRLRLAVQNAAGAKFWVYDAGGTEWVAFDASLAHDGELWTPSVAGDAIVLEISGEADLDILEAAAIREIAPEGTECIRDAACAAGLPEFGKAIGRYEFVSGGDVALCSGGLLNNDGGTSGDPLFLTANHCVSTASEAASVEVVWDYRAATCNGIAPSRGSLPRTNGASLLVTSEQSDTTLLRLSSTPGGRWFLGWDPNPVAGGTELLRLSHPDGGPMKYSTTTVIGSGSTCSGLPRPRFIYSAIGIGSIAGGASGAPVLRDAAAGYVVGQLMGHCGTRLSDECSALNDQVDGAFATSYPLFRQYLRPGSTVTPPPCGACVANATTACMLGDRFKVSMVWKDYSAGLQGSGSVIKYADNRPVVDPTHGAMSESTFWSMYSFNPDSIEALVRILRGTNINDKFWVFLTGFASAEYTVTVQDTKTCATWTRKMDSGTTTMIKDFTAFPLP